MVADTIRYDILVQEALRGMVRDLLADAAKKGLPGDHHFFITFDTKAEGVHLSDRLREQYPEEMTVVLQYQFRDLKLTERAFEVVLSFGGVPERLHIPFTAIKGFADPSVQFVLQFEALTLPSTEPEAATATGAAETPKQPKAKPPARQSSRASVPASPLPNSPSGTGAERPPAAREPHGEPPGDKPGAEVVRLDRFRKK